MRWAPVLLLLGAALAGCIGTDGGEDVTQASVDELVPALSITPGTEVEPGTPLTFDASGTLLPEGVTATYDWSLGDGTTGTGPVVEHTYPPGDGTYQVLLTVAGDDGDVKRKVATITVGSGVNDAPVVTLEGPKTWLKTGEEVTFTATASDEDETTIRWLAARPSAGGGGGGHSAALLSPAFMGPGHGGGDTLYDDGVLIGEGESLTTSFDERGPVKLIAEAVDAKQAVTRAEVVLTISDTVPAKELLISEEGTLAVGSGGSGASSTLYGATEPRQNTDVDSAVYELRLAYPGQGVLFLELEPEGDAAGGAEVRLLDNQGNVIQSAIVEPGVGAQRAEAPVNLVSNVYTLEVHGTVGAQLNYVVGLDLELGVGGLDPVVVTAPNEDDGHAHGEDEGDHGH